MVTDKQWLVLVFVACGLVTVGLLLVFASAEVSKIEAGLKELYAIANNPNYHSGGAWVVIDHSESQLTQTKGFIGVLSSVFVLLSIVLVLLLVGIVVRWKQVRGSIVVSVLLVLVLARFSPCQFSHYYCSVEMAVLGNLNTVNGYIRPLGANTN